MKRFHVHVSVTDLADSIRFYSTLFGTQPAVTEADYAKWMLDDPAVNFAISARGAPAGVDHLGLQVDSDEDLAGITARLAAAERRIAEQDDAACCYAKSNKTWAADPQGVAWETFHTTGRIDLYGADSVDPSAFAPLPADAAASACCSGSSCGGNTACG
ncbi:MAG: ArsI/CadI family heavy metal resistance metalloenzyme [Alphaproteobacteria bacterium]